MKKVHFINWKTIQITDSQYDQLCEAMDGKGVNDFITIHKDGKRIKTFALKHVTHID